MGTYAVFVPPAHGHVNPTLAVAQELVARGEQVIYYLPEAFRAAVEATGASFHLYEGEAFRQMRGSPPVMMTSKNADGSFVISKLLDAAVRESVSMVPRFVEEMRTEHVDYILYERIFLLGRLLSQILHLPAVQLNPSYAVNERTDYGRFMRGGNLQALAERFAALNEELARLCEAYHLPRYGLQALTQPVDLNIVFLPRAFQPGGETFDERFVFVGPSLQAQRLYHGDFPLERLDKHPQLYISLGTAFNNQVEFYKMCFDAFGQTEWQVVLAFGQQIDPTQLKEQPTNFIAAPHVPQLEVLPHMDVFVSHGGMNSTMESLTFGVPLVVVPQMPEQAMTARRVQELGLGIALDKETVTAGTLRSAVERVMHDASFRSNVQKMQQEIRDAGGSKRAVDEIVRYVHGVK